MRQKMNSNITEEKLDKILYYYFKIEQYNKAIEKDLNDVYIKRLLKLLKNEEFEILSILEFYYLYDQSFKDIEEVLGFTNIEEKLKINIVEYSNSIGLEKDHRISNKSLRKALLINQNNNEKNNNKKILLNKNILVIAASILLILGSVITISGKNNLINISKTKINYEISKNDINYSNKKALNYRPKYIPQKYGLVYYSASINQQKYYYKFLEDNLDSKNLRYCYIEIKNVDNRLKLYRDKESNIEEIKINNEIYYLISDDIKNEIIFIRNNVFFSISGTLSRDELIKIASNIKYIR